MTCAIPTTPTTAAPGCAASAAARRLWASTFARVRVRVRVSGEGEGDGEGDGEGEGEGEGEG